MSSKGVSVLVGIMLAMLIGMIFLSIMQTQYVPILIKNVELKHLNEITKEIYDLGKSLKNCKMMSISMNLGVQYPKYPFLLTPQTLSSSISCDDFDLNITYFEEFPQDGFLYSLNTSSKRMRITVNYFSNPDYEFVYENTALFKRISGTDKFIIVSEQTMFSKGYVNVYIINSTFNSVSTVQPIDLSVVPISYGGEVFARNLTVEFESVYPEYWNGTLRELGYSVSVEGEKVVVRAEDVTLRIYYSFLVKGLSISPETSVMIYKSLKTDVKPYRIIKTDYVNVESIEIQKGQSLILGARVLDRFNNPVSGESVTISVNGEIGHVSSSIGYTDLEGDVNIVFNSETIGHGSVEFYCENCSYEDRITYNITVVESSVTGAAGNVTVDLSSNPPPDESAPVKTLIARVQGVVDGEYYDLKGYTVVFAVDDPNLRLSEDVVTTNESGIATTTVYQIVSGDNWYKVCAFSGSSADCIRIRLNGSAWLPGWNYRIPVYIKERSGEDLVDYQIAVELDSTFNWSAVNEDGSDIRFTDSDAITELRYWIEDWNYGSYAKIWVRVPVITANEKKKIYMYYGNETAVSESDKDGTFPEFMEVRKITVPKQSYEGQWFSVSFQNEFSEIPVVIAEPDQTYNEGDELRFRLKDISSSGFKIRQQEPSNRDDIHASEGVTYIAIPVGSWITVGGDIRIEANRFSTSSWLSGDGSTYLDKWNSVSFRYSFPEAPVVFSQIQDFSYGDFAHTRQKDVTSTGFEVSPEPEGNVLIPPTTSVTIGWIAVEKHVGTIDGDTKSEANVVRGVDELWKYIYFSQAYSKVPNVIAWMQTYNGGDSAGVRGERLSKTRFRVMIEEDMTYDYEKFHKYENVGYFVIEKAGKFHLRKYLPKDLVPYVELGEEERSQ